MPKKKTVLHIAAECYPFAKVGGLADVVGSLPQAVAKQGYKSAVLLPKYGSIPKQYKLKKIAAGLSVNIGDRPKHFNLYHTRLTNNPVDYYFIDHEIFRGKRIYDTTKKINNLEKFTFFSKAAVETIRQYLPYPDLIHAHDWHTGLVPTFVDQISEHYAGFHQIKTLFTIHNLAMQGLVLNSFIEYAHVNPSEEPALMEDYYDDNHLNLIKIAILSADKINTVSPTYAKEILTKENGEHLEEYLKRRRRDLSGILNGLSLINFNPQTDKALKFNFNKKNWKPKKQQNKKTLQKELGLPESNVPLLSLVSRLTNQKGLDILLPVLTKLIAKDLQIVILGTGEEKYHKAIERLIKKYPDKIAARLKFDSGLARRIYAGSDIFLMPSKFEPCGLGQMIAMRYATVPVVRATGGLKDTVINNKTGFVFKPYTQKALKEAIENALNIFKQQKKWYTMINNCLNQDFSWKKSAKEYIKLYKSLI